jgi:hypothetical protein
MTAQTIHGTITLEIPAALLPPPRPAQAKKPIADLVGASARALCCERRSLQLGISFDFGGDRKRELAKRLRAKGFAYLADAWEAQ